MGRRILEPPALSGLVAMAVAVGVLIWRWSPITAGHPSYLIFYSLVILLGAVGIGMVLRRPGPRRPVLSTMGAIGLVILGFAAWWLAPFPADQVAVQALSHPQGYAVSDSASAIVLEPDGDVTGGGLTFLPGARVDARAYARILAPIARGGHEVTIVKPPLGIALLSFGIDRPPGDGAWLVGGHSLGGVSASTAAGEEADGLLLWASFPAADISDRFDLRVVSIYGTADTFATTGDIEETRPNLPADTEFVSIEGGIHSFFGDYGLQPGDGEPTISREEAQEQIVSASLDLMGSIGAP